MDRPEKSILMVSHGGILRYMMNIHPSIKLRDGRRQQRETKAASKINGNSGSDGTDDLEIMKDVKSRFDNCEIRGYDISWDDDDDDSSLNENNKNKNENKSKEATESQRTIVLTQVDH